MIIEVDMDEEAIPDCSYCGSPWHDTDECFEDSSVVEDIITLEMMTEWAGDDSREDILDYLLSVINGETSIDTARSDVLQTVS